MSELRDLRWKFFKTGRGAFATDPCA